MDKEKESYLAGLILGDGHIEKGNNRIVISSTEKKFLKKVGDFLDNTFSLFFDKSAGVWKLGFYSKKLCSELNRIYSIPSGNKTNAKNIFFGVYPDKFISGLCDAEGWFEKDKGKYWKIRIKLKSKDIIQKVREELNKLAFNPRGHCKSEGSCVVEINRQDEVKSFVKKFMLIHPKWERLREALDG